MYNKEITREFIDKYKVLEKLKTENFPMYEKLRLQSADLYDELRNTRNVLAHNLNEDGNYPILVSEELLKDLNHQIGLLTKSVGNVMTPAEKITACRLTTPVANVINFMNKKNISHVPVLNEYGMVTHVVSFNAIISIISGNRGIIGYDEKSIISNYRDYFEIANNKDEYYLFMGMDELAYHAKERMQQRIDNKKCGIIFVTRNGKENEKLLGVVSSYDLMKL